MSVHVHVASLKGAPPGVRFRWDADTEILSAEIAGGPGPGGLTGSIELEGQDGSWLVLEVDGGRICSIEVAVWPEVRTVKGLAVPADVAAVSLSVPARSSQPGIATMEVTAPLRAESDPSEKTIHFVLSQGRTRTVRVGSDVLFDLDRHDAITGVWLCNVPPFTSAP
ncbi:MAG: hypothetical protein HYX65_11120 [Gemmatimonadetes bacterium]|nr:hypothetical protein [Gemmatimonadota bacterium]